MPGSDGELGFRPASQRALKSELSTLRMLEMLRSDIRHLSLRRQDIYLRAHGHRQDGQLVPASLCEELAQNESRLRCVIDRYTGALA